MAENHWLQIFTRIADMQPGDIDKLSKQEADLVRHIVDCVDKGKTLCLSSEEFTIVNAGLNKLQRIQ